MRLTILVAVLVVATAFLPAQTPAPTLERGIYAETTSGNLDEAISIYRQVLKSQAPRQTLAQAQYHLAAALIKKGDVTQGQTEASVLQRSFGDSPELIQDIQTQMRAALSKLGEVTNNTYRHAKTGIEIPLPAGWSALGTGPSSDSGEMVDLRDANSNAQHIDAWMIAENNAPDQIEYQMQLAIGMKVRQRLDSGIGLTVRLNEVQKLQISGHSGVIFIGDFQQSGKPMVEYFAYVVSGKTRVQFRAIASPEDFPLVRTRFENIIFGARIP